MVKKFILFVTTIIFSLIFVNNKTYAQEALFPGALIKARYVSSNFIKENELTYEYDLVYEVDFRLEDIPSPNEYYLVGTFFYLGDFINFRKGYIPTTNSYSINTIEPYTKLTRIYLRVTTRRGLFQSPYREYLENFFRNEVSLFIKLPPDLDSLDYQIGYSDGYLDGYEKGLNDFDVADYFGNRNIVKDVNTKFNFDLNPNDSTGIIVFNKEYSGDNIYNPNILVDQPYMIVMIRKNIYDRIAVIFDDGVTRYQSDARYFDMDDFDIYIFDFSDRWNKKYVLEITKENIVYNNDLLRFVSQVLGSLYFSHAPRLLNSDQALKFYEMGFLAGLVEILEDDEVYQIGYENGYNRGYYDGNEQGYEKGYEFGYDIGYDKGYTIGNEIGYEKGFEDGYDLGFNYGKTVDYDDGYKDGYNQGLEDGYDKGVKDGYKEGAYDTFLNDVAKWFGPMVLIVLLAGAYITLRNRRSED